MGFFSRLKKIFSSQADEETQRRESLLDNTPADDLTQQTQVHDAPQAETNSADLTEGASAAQESVEEGESAQKTPEVLEKNEALFAEKDNSSQETPSVAKDESLSLKDDSKKTVESDEEGPKSINIPESVDNRSKTNDTHAAEEIVPEQASSPAEEVEAPDFVQPNAFHTSLERSDDLLQEKEHVPSQEMTVPLEQITVEALATEGKEERSEEHQVPPTASETLEDQEEKLSAENLEESQPFAQTPVEVLEPVPARDLEPSSAEALPGMAEEKAGAESSAQAARSPDQEKLVVRLREAEPRLSVWLGIVLDGVEETGDLFFERLRFLLRSLEAPEEEIESFVGDFASWLEAMEYTYVDEFRSELQYRLALALELEDEEDERNRLLVKIHEGLAKTREQLQRKITTLLTSHGTLDEAFYEHLEEIFITADLGYEASLELVERLRNRAQSQDVKDAEEIGRLLREELEEIFHIPPHITAYTAPEVVLMVGVNGVGKTTTIGKLAHRARLQGRKVMICAADTFRAAAIEQLKVWAERAGALFHAKQQGSDPASVAYEALDLAMRQGVDLLFIDTAGRLQTKTNLMEELSKIRNVIGKKHPGSPHRTVLVIDATTGQNALSQVKLFREASGVDELIITKLDGTAKGGFAIALALQHHLPFSFIGLGEKLEDLRPFSGKDFADALIGSLGKTTESEENS